MSKFSVELTKLQKAAQASKMELKTKRNLEKGNKKGFAVTQSIQYYTHGRGTQRGYSSKQINIALLNIF